MTKESPMPDTPPPAEEETAVLEKVEAAQAKVLHLARGGHTTMDEADAIRVLLYNHAALGDQVDLLRSAFAIELSKAMRAEAQVAELTTLLEAAVGRVGELGGPLRKLHADCLANDFNNCWDSYTEVAALLAKGAPPPSSHHQEQKP